MSKDNFICDSRGFPSRLRVSRGFTPLEMQSKGNDSLRKRLWRFLSLTGFTPLETKTQPVKIKRFLTGFTLIEIMIVVALISALALLAMPAYLRSRMISNETMALTSLKTIYSSCQLFYSNNNTYPPAGLTDLAIATPSYIDTVLASGQKQGYQFGFTFTDSNNFSVNADPLVPGGSGERYFYMDETGVIRSAKGLQATATDPPVY